MRHAVRIAPPPRYAVHTFFIFIFLLLLLLSLITILFLYIFSRLAENSSVTILRIN